MAGQPDLPGWLVFNVTDLTVSDNTVEKGTSFDITVTFTGTGGIWALLELISDSIGTLNTTAQFYVEGMGIGPGEYDLGSIDIPLAVGGSPYSASLAVDTSTAPTDLDEGVYRAQCLVQVEDSAIMGYFDDDLLVSVYE